MNAEKSPVNHNVDHEEIAKFEAVASRWWDLEGEFNRCTALTRCVWAILPSVLAVYLAKRCSMSVVAAAFWPRVWRAKARR